MVGMVKSRIRKKTENLPYPEFLMLLHEDRGVSIPAVSIIRYLVFALRYSSSDMISLESLQGAIACNSCMHVVTARVRAIAVASR